MIKLTKEQFDVPSGIMLEVCGLICEHELQHAIVEVDEDADTISLEIQYSKQDREVIHQIEDLIADNSEDDDDDDDE
ncbi:hypothetical protein SAMN05518672_10943 [Chitinophaga sp. CF118]|uniref:hypothetical protein n=1 Tax=Chitinophaga sp. CF118 TaxID=1884367 RepID=UPI0008F0A08E|nr:hypothetical protein [Chitinophaga sp. CF118]SFE67741.1 hypothetical protein SAMN05518672_10943 [Chitinophaga sp. CF118]